MMREPGLKMDLQLAGALRQMRTHFVTTTKSSQVNVLLLKYCGLNFENLFLIFVHISIMKMKL